MIENVGSVLACIGAVFNCSPTREQKRIGFGIWIVSNILFFIWAWSIQAWAPMATYLLFTGTATYGFVNHKHENQIGTQK